MRLPGISPLAIPQNSATAMLEDELLGWVTVMVSFVWGSVLMSALSTATAQ